MVSKMTNDEMERQAFEAWFCSEMDIDIRGFRNDDPSTNIEWPYAAVNRESSSVITTSYKAWKARARQENNDD